LSYSSEDAGAAERIREALAAAGLEVWFDKEELRGGDAWDASIRKQIRECALFVPIVSAATNARLEGYFRLEWKLAVDRSLLMSEDRPFIVPVAIDATSAATARVPDRFRELQWTRLGDDASLVAFAKRVRDLLLGTREEAPTRSGPVTTSRRLPARKPGRLRIAAAGIATLLVAVAGFAIYKVRSFEDRSSGLGAAAADTRMSFAVLPIAAPQGDTEASDFANALAEALMLRQANSPWSRAVSRESVQNALRSHPAPRDVGRALNVRYLLRGGVMRQGNNLAATIAVVDAESDHVLGSEQILWPVQRKMNAYRREFEQPVARLADRAYAQELADAKRKKSGELDARDLAYLANDAWNHSKTGYDAAMGYLQRAMAQAPDDRLVLTLLAKVNLCECAKRFSSNPKEQQQIGIDAVETYLAHHPPDRTMLIWQLEINTLRGRFEDSLVLLDRMLEASPDDPELLSLKAYNLVKLGRPREALAPIEAALREDASADNRSSAAVIHFQLSDDERALDLIRKAIPEMSRKEREDAWAGSVLLIRIAAATNLGRTDQVKIGLDDFSAAAPGVRTISQIRKWMDPRAMSAGHEPLYAALRKAGIPD